MAIRPQMRFDVDDDLYKKIEACKTLANEQSNAETCRRLLLDATERQLIAAAKDTVTVTIRRVIKEEIKVTENRLAKIVGKTAIAASTAMYMCYQVLASLGIKDMSDIYQVARKKAVGFVKTPLDEITSVEELPESE